MRLESNGFMNGGAPADPYPGSLLREQAEFGDNPAGLRMFSYVPAKLGADAPLLVILHGCLQNARGYDHGAGWSSLAKRLGFALLAPEQVRTNNPNGCFNWFVPEQTARGGGEVASIRQMIARMAEDHVIDPQRIFVTGLSAGGALTGALLAAYPEVFAGGAIIAGLPYGAASNIPEAMGAMRRTAQRTPESWGDAVRGASPHKGPWPRVSVWHGDADSTVAYSNMDAIIAQWRDVHDLSGPPLETQEGGHLRRTWHDARLTPVIEAYTISGLGHGTPIRSGRGKEACGVAGPFILEAGISSSYRIAAFFGLTQGAAVPAVEDIADVEPEVAVTEPAEDIIVARPKITILDPLIDDSEDALEPEEPLAGRLHRIINKALKSAGLIKNS